MISFRFHLVSLAAVFVAIALGIAVGATVVDRATVALLERQVEEVDARLDRTDAENRRLQAALSTWDQFATEAGDRFAVGRLTGVPIVVIAARGGDAVEDEVARLVTTLEASGATVPARLWLHDRFRLASSNDTRELAVAAGVIVSSNEATRRAALSKLAAGLAGTGTGVVAPLQAAGFVDIESAAGVTDLITTPETRFVVVAGAGSDIPLPDGPVPLAVDLAREAPRRTVAAEPGHDATGGQRAVRGEFVGLLRRSATEQALSTVDNLEDSRGRLAVVLALVDLGEDRVGHYGVGPKATALLPPQPAPAS